MRGRADFWIMLLMLAIIASVVYGMFEVEYWINWS